jgi:serine/threonine protein kinase
MTAIQQELSELGYTLVRKLSGNDRNGHSKVWLANYKLESGLTSQRAVKLSSTLMMEAPSDNDAMKLDDLTQREIEIMRKIDHPNIPALKDFQRISIEGIASVDVMATAYEEGEDLLDIVQSRKKLDEIQSKNVLDAVLSALDHIHTELDVPVLHRDIKPSNILYGDARVSLLDFNFSRMGDGSSSSTMVDNHGYYPVDSYSGRQTPSQDLVALGNTVIAAAMGMEISEVRNLQNKTGLDAVDVDDLSFSPKLQRFLRKLTAVNPALRYQTAEQALADLRQLDKLSEEELDRKINNIERSPGLKNLLAGLKETDKLFDYNVPPNIRTTYDDESLVEYLEKVYSQEEFVVEDPGEIKKYLTVGDMVEMKAAKKFGKCLVEKGEEGRLKSFDTDEGTATVKFKNKVDVPLMDLSVTGKKTGWLSRDHHGAVPVSGLQEGLNTKMFVQYKGDDLWEYDARIPAGAIGIYLGQIDKELCIIWQNKEGTVQDFRQLTNDGNTYGFRPADRWDSEDVKLKVPNPIDFKRLYKESIDALSERIVEV